MGKLPNFEKLFKIFGLKQRIFKHFRFKNVLVGRGVFRRALCHGPPLWVARIVKLHRKVSKIEAWPPPLCKLGIRFDNTKGMFCALLLGFGLKIGGNLSEDLFFCSSPNFGRKIGQNLSGTISDSDLCSSQIF